TRILTPKRLLFFIEVKVLYLKLMKTYCREEQFPCTRLYSVHKPVKQCISYLCVTSVRRMYIINKEVCSRIVCKENEVMQDEICRQLAGLPSRRLRRSGQSLNLPCRQLVDQQRRRPDAL
uniref:Microfibril associated protein 5 n=1 Tax=Apteryx owenii TaxID=8824 RepID=A0A8B9P2Y5_APTOW